MALHLIEYPNAQHRVIDDAGNGSEFLIESPWKYPATASVDLTTFTLHALPPDDLKELAPGPGVAYTIIRSTT